MRSWCGSRLSEQSTVSAESPPCTMQLNLPSVIHVLRFGPVILHVKITLCLGSNHRIVPLNLCSGDVDLWEHSMNRHERSWLLSKSSESILEISFVH
jgi:hypothetical protein